MELYEIEIFCDGPGCQTTTTHSLWAESERAAFTKARAFLVGEAEWARASVRSAGQPDRAVDLCPMCKTYLVKELRVA